MGRFLLGLSSFGSEGSGKVDQCRIVSGMPHEGVLGLLQGR